MDYINKQINELENRVTSIEKDIGYQDTNIEEMNNNIKELTNSINKLCIKMSNQEAILNFFKFILPISVSLISIISFILALMP